MAIVSKSKNPYWVRVRSFGSWLRGTSELTASTPPRILRDLRLSVPIFGGGGVSSVALAFTLAVEFQQPVFWAWSGVEVMLLAVRLFRARAETAAAELWPGRRGPVFEMMAAASIGFGSALAIGTSTWIGVLLGWIAATAFAGEACVRYLGDRRFLVGLLMLGSAPAVVACVATGTPALQLAAALMGLFAVRMAVGAHSLNAILVDSLRAERESDHRARHDRLTGLLNLAGYEREIELMRVDNPHAHLTLFYVDLDNFKQINDTLGHSAGDQVLRRVAEQLLGLVGPQDIVARIGGDEFLVVTALDLVEPAEFADALLVAVQSRESGDGAPVVTASIGVASSASYNDLAATTARADSRLYAAKRAGGNRAATND